MMCNLPYELQLLKLKNITSYITSRFGVRPKVFRAGRWGIGKETVNALISCGYIVDTSVTPFKSWKSYNGPNFFGAPFSPYFINEQKELCSPSKLGKILEVPVSIGYNRWPFEKWQNLDRIFNNRLLTFLHASGIAHRSGLLKKIWFSPEVDNIKSVLKLIKIMINNDVRLLNMSLHSNSFTPGLGPFVKNQNELFELYDSLETCFKELRKMSDILCIPLSQVKNLMTKGKI